MNRFCKNINCSIQSCVKPCSLAGSCAFFKDDEERNKVESKIRGSRNDVPLEEIEQQRLSEWCDANGILFYHIPNERKTNIVTMSKLKRQGLKTGIPDNCIPIAKNGYHGLYIELKRSKKSYSHKSPEQVKWIRELNKQGYKACFCYGCEDAIEVIKEYLK